MSDSRSIGGEPVTLVVSLAQEARVGCLGVWLPPGRGNVRQRREDGGLIGVLSSREGAVGMRPLPDRLQKGVSGHLLVTVLACHVGYALRHRLTNTRDRQQLEFDTQDRTRTCAELTTTMGTADGQMWSQWQEVHSNNERARIAATGVSFRRHRQVLPLAHERTADGVGMGKEKESACNA